MVEKVGSSRGRFELIEIGEIGDRRCSRLLTGSTLLIGQVRG